MDTQKGDLNAFFFVWCIFHLFKQISYLIALLLFYFFVSFSREKVTENCMLAIVASNQH